MGTLGGKGLSNCEGVYWPVDIYIDDTSSQISYTLIFRVYIYIYVRNISLYALTKYNICRKFEKNYCMQ